MPGRGSEPEPGMPGEDVNAFSLKGRQGCLSALPILAVVLLDLMVLYLERCQDLGQERLDALYPQGGQDL